MPARFSLTLAAAVSLGLCACDRAASQPDLPAWDEALRTGGLAAAEQSLAAEDAAPDTSFLLGGVRFLQAFEHILQVRYANHSGSVPLVPGMRNELPPNPDGQFDPAFVETAMSGALTHLDAAREALEPVLSGEFAAELQLADVWLDINANGAREEWESLIAIMGGLGAAPGEEFDGVIRFDTADAEWLAAYVHLLSGMAELTLAMEPTPAIATVMEGRARMEALGELQGDPFSGDDTLPDTIAAVLLTLRGEPDAGRTRAAHSHFLSMVERNRAFWAEVGEETDNDREWLPAPGQASAFGVEVTEEMADSWQAVLADIERLLNGETLVPYWRVGGAEPGQPGVGLNIRRLMEEPGDMDIILWLQGAAAAPYLEEGEMADMAAWNRFMRMTRGDAILFAAWFN